MSKHRVTHTEHFDYYENEPVASPWEVILYIVKSMLTGLGLITFIFLIGYWSVK